MPFLGADKPGHSLPAHRIKPEGIGKHNAPFPLPPGLIISGAHRRLLLTHVRA